MIREQRSPDLSIKEIATRKKLFADAKRGLKMKDAFKKGLFVFIVLIGIAVIAIPFISVGIWIGRKDIKTLEAEYKSDFERLNKTCALYSYGVSNR